LVSKTQTDDTANTALFAYDSLGQMSANAAGGPDSSVIVPTAYGYDPAGHLVCIGATAECAPEDTTAVTFGIDALGRHGTRTVASSGLAETYAYLGTANTVSSIYDGTSLTYSAIDAIGDRLASGTAAASAYLLPDLHGNVVATISVGAGPTYVGAYRYDAYGETCDTYTPASGAVDSPWRYQGRIRESAQGSPDLYDFTARSYSPGLGAFTSLDSVTGSAQNPLSLNRFLYATANPATLVDPSGHAPTGCTDPNWSCWGLPNEKETKTTTPTKTGGLHLTVRETDDGLAYLTDDNGALVGNEDLMRVHCAGGDQPSADGSFARPECKALYLARVRDQAAFDAWCVANPEKCKKYNESVTKENYHIGLGLCSLMTMTVVLSPIGLGCSGVNAAWYASDGDYGQALLAGLPLGFAGGGKLLGWALKFLKAGDEFTVPVPGAESPTGVGDVPAMCSFTQDTVVATSAASVAIASIRVGDTIEAYDPKTGETGPHIVTAVMAHTDPAIEHLATDTGTIDTTPNHPFFTTDRGWVEAGSLRVGEKVRTETGGSATVTGFTIEAAPTTMWDLTVDGAHSFFVGQGAVLVHNCGPAGGEPVVVTFSKAQGWLVSHGGRHLLEAGLSEAEVSAAEVAIAADAVGAAPQAAGSFFTGSVNVGGRTIMYNGYRLADGSINVGTFMLLKP
jgi:RHS repeat-associated protein